MTRAELDADAAITAVRNGKHDLVLMVTEDYVTNCGRRARAGRSRRRYGEQPDDGRCRSRAATPRSYGRQLAALRLLVRGISPQVIEPVDVHTLDVATPAGRSLLILGMMTYFCFMSMLVGGFYLAIDTTAGERERGSLEPFCRCRCPRRADRRQDAGDLGIHGRLAAADAGRVRHRARVRAARGARHVRQFRAAGDLGIFA